MNPLYFLVENAFKSSLTDARKKGKKLIEKLSKEAVAKLDSEMRSDLKAKGYGVKSLDISLGTFRASYFVTSAKLYVTVKADQDANDLLKYLQDTYSPKFKLKNVEGAVAFYNVR
jgi:hypothetical protein